MRVMTWNVNHRQSAETAKDLCRIIDEDARADVVALQEVAWGRDEVYEKELGDRGYQWFYSRRRGDGRLYGSAVAIRKSVGEARELQRLANLPSPELLAAVELPNVGTIVSVHIPNGAGNGWDKIASWEAIIEKLATFGERVVFAGDFNGPAIETKDQTICWGYQLSHEGRFTDALTQLAAELGHEQAAALPRRHWGNWEQWGQSGTGERWERAEAWIYDRARGHGLIDAYRSLHGYEARENGYSHLVNGKVPVRYDHVFLRGMTAVDAEYRLDLLESRRSDHAPLLVEVADPRSS